MFGFNREELTVLKKLNTPRKIQDFLETLKANFKNTCHSPRVVLKTRRAHCMEGAMLAAVALRLCGFKPLVVDLDTVERDEAHVLTVFRRYGHWGAVTKTNHAVLRYRDPVFKNIRELVMSYFNEYFDKKGIKTLRSYSLPINLARFDKQGWMTSQKNVWYIPEYLANSKHYPILRRAQIAGLRQVDPIEIKAGELVVFEE